ncbi:unnamed protein product [Durusdinium trenchii]|uniref:Uncharacterized protein n=1 Tax=Durusdinium trenchii TaxID=1381693 RepID=A0ABP0KX60_9DINO
MSLLHRLSSDREFAFNYSMSSVTSLSKSCVYRLWERQLMGDHGHPVGVFMSCRNFHASKQTILDRNGGSMWKHYSRHEWELLFQPSDCGPCRVHVVRPDEPILQSLCNGLATWEGQSESLQNSVDQASLRVAVAQSALGSPAFLEICRPSCPRDTDRNSDAAELEAPNLLRADAELRAAEEALPPSGRYAALLERVVQLGSAETGRSKVTSHGPGSSGAKIAEENAWL